MVAEFAPVGRDTAPIAYINTKLNGALGRQDKQAAQFFLLYFLVVL